MKFILLCAVLTVAINSISGQSSRRMIGPQLPPHHRLQRHNDHHQVERPERPQWPQRPVSSFEIEEDNTGHEPVAPSGHRHHVDESAATMDLTEDDVQAVVCSEADIPEKQIMDFDKCTRHIPPYRELNILKRCREKLMIDLTLNEQRLQLCFNKTAEDRFKGCAQEISNREGQHLPEMSDHDGQLFMRCMREVASRPRTSLVAASAPPVVPATSVPLAASARMPTWLTPERPSAIAREHEAFLTPADEYGSSSGYLPKGGDRQAGVVDDHADPPLYEDEPPAKPKSTQSRQFSARIETGRGKKPQRISGIITAALYDEDQK